MPPPVVTADAIRALCQHPWRGNVRELSNVLDRFERAHIAMVLRLCEGNREKAADELGVSPATLYRRLEKLGLKGTDVQRGKG